MTYHSDTHKYFNWVTVCLNGHTTTLRKKKVIVNSVLDWKKISSGILAETIIMLTLFNVFTDDSERRKKIWRSELLSTLKSETTEYHLYKLSTDLNCYRVSDRWRELSWGAGGGQKSMQIQNKNYSVVTVWGIMVDNILSKHFSSIFP